MTLAHTKVALVVLSALTLAACAKTASLQERLPGTYTAHETAATMTYTVKEDGSATLHAVTNLGEAIDATATYTVAGDSARVSLTPAGGGAAQSRTWTLHGDTLVEIAGDKRTAFVRGAR